MTFLFLLGTGEPRTGLRGGGGIRTRVSWMAPVFQILVDRVSMLCLLPYCRGLGYARLHPVQAQLHGKTPRPPGPLPGAESLCPDGQLTGGLGGARGARASPRLCSYPAPQVATCPGWVVCVDSWQRRMWPLHPLPTSLLAKGWRQLCSGEYLLSLGRRQGCVG